MNSKNSKIIIPIVSILLVLVIIAIVFVVITIKNKDNNSNSSLTDTGNSSVNSSSSNNSSSNISSKVEVVTGQSVALDSNKAHVILLCGQSNATGQTMVSYLEKTATDSELAEYKAGYNNVLINYRVDGGSNRSNGFVPVTLGQGATKEKFGPEVGIASYLSKAFPNEKFYIVKVAWSGSGIAQHWQEGKNEYTHIINYIDSAFSNLEQQGLDPELFAFCWMQGATDALNSLYANDYYNLQSELFTRLFDRYGKYASKEGITVIDAGISQFWQYNKVVNEAKKKYANESELRYFIDTQAEGLTFALENNDPSHYDSQAMIKLGNLFGKYIQKAATKK